MKLNKKLRDLTPEELKEINKIMGDCQIIAFDSEEIMEKRQLAVNLRMAAHETLLEADLLDDEIIKTLMGIKDVKSEKRVGRLIKNKRLGKKA
jgi:hypothetical protein